MSDSDVIVNIAGDLHELKQSLNEMKGQVNEWGSGVRETIMHTLEAFGLIEGIKLGVEAIKLSAETLAEWVQEAAECEEVTTRLNKFVENTGPIFGHTTDQLVEYAKALEGVTTAHHTEIIQMEQIAIKYQVTGDMMERLTKDALDLAAGLGTDGSAAMQKLGVAMENPQRAMRVLREAGILLTASQREQIKVWVESGESIKAQEMILGLLESKYQGFAATMSHTTEGEWKQFLNVVKDAKEAIGEGLIPIIKELEPVITFLAAQVREFAESFKEGFGKDLKESLDGGAVDSFAETVVGALARMKQEVENFIGGLDGIKLSLLEVQQAWLKFQVFRETPWNFLTSGAPKSANEKALDHVNDDISGLQGKTQAPQVSGDQAASDAIAKYRDFQSTKKDEDSVHLADTGVTGDPFEYSKTHPNYNPFDTPQFRESMQAANHSAEETAKKYEEIIKANKKNAEEEEKKTEKQIKFGNEQWTRRFENVNAQNIPLVDRLPGQKDGTVARFEDATSVFKRIQESTASTKDADPAKKTALNTATTAEILQDFQKNGIAVRGGVAQATWGK